jgi:hypothetical protein
MQQSPQVAAARAFARSFNILLKYVRLYGFDHKQTTTQFDVAWKEVRSALRSEQGLLLGVAGGKVLLDGAPLEMGLAEKSFAQTLSVAGISSLQFLPSATPEDFVCLLRAFSVSKPAGLLAELQRTLRKDGGIHFNSVRFIVDQGKESAVAQELTARILGKVDGLQDWMNDPAKLIELITAAEGKGKDHGESSSQPVDAEAAVESNLGVGAGAGMGAGLGAAAMAGVFGNGKVGSAEFQAVLRVLEKMVAAQTNGDGVALGDVHRTMAELPESTEDSLQRALAVMAAQVDSGQKIDGTVMLKLAEHLAIRFALDSYERGDIRVNAVREMLERLSSETEKLRRVLGAHEERMERAGLLYETHADILDRQFWAAVPEKGKRAVLLSDEAYCIPARNIRNYVEELLRAGDRTTPSAILRQYLNGISHKEDEARRRVAVGLSEIADLYASLEVTLLAQAIDATSAQLLQERNTELHPLISAAFVRLSQEATTRRDYIALQRALARGREVEERRPMIGRDVRPRIAIDNRLREFIEDGIRDANIPAGLIEVLRVSQPAAIEEIVTQFGRSTRRDQCERLVNMAGNLGDDVTKHLTGHLLNGSAGESVATIGLLSRLAPDFLASELPKRLKSWSRYHQDGVIRQIAAASSSGENAALYADLLPALDPLMVPIALEEMASSNEPLARRRLLQIACGDEDSVSPYLQVRAIETLGRLRDVSAAPELLKIVSKRGLLGWDFARELRIASAQTLLRTDSSLIRPLLNRSDITQAELELGPLELDGTDQWVRQRRYARFTPTKSLTATATVASGRCHLELKRLSLGGGLAVCDRRIPTATELVMELPMGLKRCRSHVLVRELRGREVSFEILDIKLEDRTRLRQLLTHELRNEVSTAGRARVATS